MNSSAGSKQQNGGATKSAALTAASSSQTAVEKKNLDAPMTMQQLQQLQKQLEIELKQIEISIFEKENQYLIDSQPFGNVTKGWEGIGTGTVGGASQTKQSGQNRGKQQKFSQLDRLFSYSSSSAPTQEEDHKSNSMYSDRRGGSYSSSSFMNQSSFSNQDYATGKGSQSMSRRILANKNGKFVDKGPNSIQKPIKSSRSIRMNKKPVYPTNKRLGNLPIGRSAYNDSLDLNSGIVSESKDEGSIDDLLNGSSRLEPVDGDYISEEENESSEEVPGEGDEEEEAEGEEEGDDNIEEGSNQVEDEEESSYN